MPLALIGLVAQGASWWQTFDNQSKGAMYFEACFAVVATCAYSLVLDSWRFHQNRTAHVWEVVQCRVGRVCYVSWQAEFVGGCYIACDVH
jgi:hypothetical protein